jgi:hypothetical protein
MAKYSLHTRRGTQMVYILSFSTLTYYKWRIHGIFILETTLLVGYECIKHSACEGLHLWRNWRVLFLIWCSPLTVCTPSTKIVITSYSKVEWMHRLFGGENIIDYLSNHIAYDLQNRTVKVAHPIEI